MDELEISGKRYISTRRAAREHGYHSDYMGQLIRGKKVAGQKVGRAWYIEEDSLNAYLGKAPALTQAPIIAPAPLPVVEAAPAPVERLIVEEPAPIVAPVAIPEPIAQVVAPEPVVPYVAYQPVEVPVKKEEEFHPIAVRVEPKHEPVYAQPYAQEIHHAPYIEENQRRVPLHAQAPQREEVGGLRYASDDMPSIPVVSRMQQAPAYQQYQAPEALHAARSTARFPYVSLSIVGILVALATAFASNFVSATIVSEEGKAATVQYAIHW